jgi:serine/threonine protein phosphatase PrpC
MDAAVAAAQTAATDAARQVGAVENPPACTFVASVAAGPLIATAWMGDSRAYWLGDDGTATQLSTDDSWATSQVEQGVARTVAEADSRAHAITRWLGRDSPGGPPSYASMTVTSPGWLLVCSDGLWNYCSDAESIRDLVSSSGGGAGEPMAIAEALVIWANEQGGHDNITAALARIPSETGGTDHGHLTTEVFRTNTPAGATDVHAIVPLRARSRERGTGWRGAAEIIVVDTSARWVAAPKIVAARRSPDGDRRDRRRYVVAVISGSHRAVACYLRGG